MQFKYTSQHATTGLSRTRYFCISSLLTVKEVVSDSWWGCGPIRARDLENDEWGWFMEPRRNIDIQDAHSCLTEWVQTDRESLPHRIMLPTSEAICALQHLPLLHSIGNPWAYTLEWQGLDLNLENNAWRFPLHHILIAAKYTVYKMQLHYLKCFTDKEFKFLSCTEKAIVCAHLLLRNTIISQPEVYSLKCNLFIFFRERAKFYRHATYIWLSKIQVGYSGVRNIGNKCKWT